MRSLPPQILSAARKQFGLGGPRRLVYTLPPLVVESLKVLHLLQRSSTCSCVLNMSFGFWKRFGASTFKQAVKALDAPQSPPNKLLRLVLLALWQGYRSFDVGFVPIGCPNAKSPLQAGRLLLSSPCAFSL